MSGEKNCGDTTCGVEVSLDMDSLSLELESRGTAKDDPELDKVNSVSSSEKQSMF